jgi:hypothetical protein
VIFLEKLAFVFDRRMSMVLSLGVFLASASAGLKCTNPGFQHAGDPERRESDTAPFDRDSESRWLERVL